MFSRRSAKVKPLLDIHGEWSQHSVYPDVLSVAMEDGRVVRYRIDILPKPNFGRNSWDRRGKKVHIGYMFRGNEKRPVD